MSDGLFVLVQYILPKRLLTQLMGWLASIEGGSSTHAVIRWFIKRYQVNMAEAANPDPSSFTSFNEFFTRPLKSGARPLANSEWVCPVDGALSQAGPIANGQVVQAKGHRYSTIALLGGDQTLAQQFEGGHFATIYLSPKDYHRLHMPCAGVLKKIVYVPGDLFSVNPATVRGVPGLFARNERVICLFEQPESGRMFTMILVGATIVGSIGTVWTGVVNRKREFRTPTEIAPSVHSTPLHLKQGEEMGRFLLGSTVILLAQANGVGRGGNETSKEPLWPQLEMQTEGQPLRLGQAT
jgi:phosphatidylserine decarboxylase